MFQGFEILLSIPLSVGNLSVHPFACWKHDWPQGEQPKGAKFDPTAYKGAVGYWKQTKSIHKCKSYN